MKVLVADDHAMVRRAIIAFLAEVPELTIVGEASTGDEAFEQAEQVRPDVIVMDVSMPGTGGVKAARMIRDVLADVRLVFLTMHGPESVEPLMGTWPGISYVKKDEDLNSLLSAVLGDSKQR